MKRTLNPDEIGSVLISRTDNIGDVILTLPLVYEAGNVFSNARIFFHVNEKVSPLFKGGHVRFTVIDEAGGQSFAERMKQFSKLNIDLAISARPVFGLALTFFLLGTKYRSGTAYRWYSLLYNLRVKEHRKFADRHESEYNLNLLREFAGKDESYRPPERLLGYDDSERKDFLERAGTFGLNSESGFIVIHPGSRGSARDISLEQFRDIGIKLLAAYPAYKIVYTGVESEMEIVNRSMPVEPSERIINLTGKLSLRELMMLIDHSSLFISNSTGPIHIAGALNKNIIGFYPNSAPVNDVRWRPLGTNSTIIKPANGSDDMCLIKTEDVISSAGKFLKN